MPISKRFSSASKEKIRNSVPEKKGIYELKSFGKLVYIGKAKNLRTRLLSHYRDRKPNKFRYKKAGWLSSRKKMEDKHLTQYEEKHGELPPWNTDDTRD